MRPCASAWLAAAALLAGCGAAPLLRQEARPAPVFRDARMTTAMASQAVVVGRSTRQEVAALLGPGEQLRFENGYEVWVYRARDPQARARAEELAILFDRDGVATRLRVRPAVQQAVVR
ncbi:MAG TPA: hypothetical protein VEA40_05140 [Ramlibacter sp.]|nr:hypothetical protein [Ramlibacter sp.]